MRVRLLKAAWIRLRCAFLNQHSEPYMESKIPLPTDNIYKFYALFSLFLFIFSVGALLYNSQATNQIIFKTVVEVSALKEQDKPSDSVRTRIEALERQMEIAVSDRDLFRWVLAGLSGFSFWGGVYGFFCWHRRIQPIADQMSVAQLELAKLQAAKLRAELGDAE